MLSRAVASQRLGMKSANSSVAEAAASAYVPSSGFIFSGASSMHRGAVNASLGSAIAPSTCSLLNVAHQRRYVGPRQYAPKGLRDAAARVPMSPEFGEECFALGKAAHRTKNFGDAVALFDRCLSMRREEKGPISIPCAEVLFQIGRVFIDMREYGAAENALTESAAIYEQLQGAKSEKYAESLAMLSYCYTHLKFLDEAEKGFKEAITIYRDLYFNHGDNTWIPSNRPRNDEEERLEDLRKRDPNLHPLSTVAHVLADCATLFISKGWEHRAITFLEEALEIRRYLYSNHAKFKPMIAQTLNKLAELRRITNDGAAADQYINECVDICVETLGRDSPATAAAISSKAGLLATRKKFREALQCYEEAMTTYALAFGKGSNLVGSEMIKVGRMQEMLQEHAAAEKSYRKGIDILEACARGGESVAAPSSSELVPTDDARRLPKSIPVAEAYVFLGSLEAKKMQFDNAISLFKDAVAIRKSIDKEDFNLAFIYHKIGEAYANKKESEAETFLLQSIEYFTLNAQKAEIQRQLMTDVYDDLGLFYLLNKHLDKAENCFKTALDIRMLVLGDAHPTIGYSYSNFALLYLERNEYKQCDGMCEAALNIYLRVQKDNKLAHADVYTTRGQCFEAQRKYHDAIKWFNEALEIRRIQGEASEPAAAESLHHIGKVYARMKQYGEALNYLQQAKKIATKHGAATAELRQMITTTEESIPDPSEWNTKIEE